MLYCSKKYAKVWGVCLFWDKLHHSNAIIAVLGLDLGQVIGARTALGMGAVDTLDVLIIDGDKELDLDGGVNLTALGAFHACQKLALRLIGLVSHVSRSHQNGRSFYAHLSV